MTDNTIQEKIINIINLFNNGDFDSVIKLTKNLILVPFNIFWVLRPKITAPKHSITSINGGFECF